MTSQIHAVPSAAAGAAAVRSTDPVTGDVVGEFPVDSADDVEAAVRLARTAAAWWSSLPPRERREALLRWVADLAARASELVDLVHAEHGKPRDEAYLELVPALEQVRWAARNAGRVLRRRRVWPGLPMLNHRAWVDHEPYGVVGVIGPWNYPVFAPAGTAGYALAAGNTVVLKTSEHTPAIGRFLVDAFARANPSAPPGVFSDVVGYGETGAALCRVGTDKIAFTGSQVTGRRVLTECADGLVPVLLECGGKDPMVVAGDADVAAAARAAVWGGMSNSGQTCIGVERVYVTADVRDEFLAELRRSLDGITAGSRDDAPYGPMTVDSQFAEVQSHIEDAIDNGATVLVGGPQALRRPYVDPVVLVDPLDGCKAMTKETFGPVLTVRTVEDADEAVRLANRGEFGLGASVFSRRRGEPIATGLRAGMVGINCALAYVGMPALPFGGTGRSGYGRVHGDDGLREFAQPKSYARQVVSLPGMDTSTLRRSPLTMRLIRLMVRLRYRH